MTVPGTLPPSTLITILRWICGIAAVMNLLQATVFWGFFERRVYLPFMERLERLGKARRSQLPSANRLFAIDDRQGARVLGVMRNPTLRRAWAFLNTAVFAGLWWYLGTPGAEATVMGLTR